MPGGAEVAGNPANPSAPPDVVAHYKALNPWWAQVDLDRLGYGIVAASPTAFDVTQKRLWTVKQRNLGTLPSDGFRWRLARGQTSIKAERSVEERLAADRAEARGEQRAQRGGVAG